MVEMYLSVSNNAICIDDKPTGHRQYPGFITIESLKIDAETGVYLLEFFR